MTGAEALSRPLAQRIAGLKVPTQPPRDEPDIPANVIQAASDALDRGETHYTDRPGIPELRTLVSEYLRSKFSVEVAPNAITITCGSTEARYVTTYILARAGSQILCPGDTGRIATTAYLNEVTVVQSASDPAAVSLLYLTPDDDPQQVNALLEQAAEHKWWVIWDMSGAKRVTDFHPAQNPQLASRVITINTFSTHMPGWRVGWMAGSELADKLKAFKQSLSICTTNVSQWAALELFKTL